MILSAYSIIDINPNEEYGIENPIFRLHCLKTNEDDVKIETLNGEISNFPPGSFIAGALYDILIKKMSFNKKKAGFKGYKFKSKPRILDI